MDLGETVRSETWGNVHPFRINNPAKIKLLGEPKLSHLFEMANPNSGSSSPITHTSSPNGHQFHERSHTFDVIEERVDSGFNSIRRLGRKKTKSAPTTFQEWSLPSRPYLEYVRQLLAAGWSNLQDLDEYLLNETAQQGLVVSVLDITQAEAGEATKRWPDIHNELDLKRFMEAPKGEDVKARLYMAEYQGCPASGLIETLGGALKLDPRFFQWSIHSKGHVFTPSQRHRAPYVSLGFGVLDASTPRKTDAERFKVLVYIQVKLRLKSEARSTSDKCCSQTLMAKDGLVRQPSVC